MASTTTIPAETIKRCDASKIAIGSVFSRHSFGKVTAIDRRSEMLTIENSNGDNWNIGAAIVELEFSFAEQFEEEEKISRTALIEMVTANPRTAMTINYNKKPNAKDIAKELRSGKDDMSVKDWDAKVTELLQGELRTMIGYHVCSFDEHRYLRFNEADKGQRLVNPRTLNWAIMNRTKFIVSK